jgi:hypothetical protein
MKGSRTPKSGKMGREMVFMTTADLLPMVSSCH